MAVPNSQIEDPVKLIRLTSICRQCNSRMGPLRVAEGAGKSVANRGKLCQTCEGSGCFYTAYHTIAFNYDDALELLTRCLKHLAGQPVPMQSRLRIADLPLSTDSGPYHCTNGCVTKQGKPKVANKNCIGHLCQDCCRNATQTAIDLGEERDGCKAHSQERVRARTVNIPPAQHASASSDQLPPSTTIPSQTPSNPTQSKSSQARPGGRSLATPIDRDWGVERDQANKLMRQEETLKIKNQRLMAERKKTVEIVLYHTNGQPPIKAQHFVDTYPILLLADISTLLDVSRDYSTWVDVYVEGDFKSFPIQGTGSVEVERGRPLLMQLRPNLREPLTDCPGISEYTELQPKFCSNGKRAAQTVISPIKPAKAQCMTEPSAKPSQQYRLPSFSVSPDPPTFFNLLGQSRDSGIPSSTLPESQVGPSADSDSNLTVARARAGNRIVAHPVRRYWPNDFYVCEVAEGLQKLKVLKDSDPKSNLTTNFKTVFGLDYHKTTFNKYKNIMEPKGEFKQNLIEEYIAKGQVEDARWPAFARAEKNCPFGISKEKKARRATTRSLSSDDDNFDFPSSTARTTTRSLSSDDNNFDFPSSTADTTDFDFDSDSDPSEDKRRLCSYCDEPLSLTQSQQLTDMEEVLRKKSYPDPLPENPNHRRTYTFVDFIDYCTLHKFEFEVLPMARLENWPENPDMATLSDRVLCMQLHMKELLACLLERHDDGISNKATGSDDEDEKKGNVFFTKAKKAFKGVSAAAADGAGAQYGAFSGHNAEYYGDEGSFIIEITLMQMFPENELDLSLQPLTYKSLIRYVLVPEASTLLIKTDLGVSRKKAINIMRRSQTFGSKYHPGEDSRHLKKLIDQAASSTSDIKTTHADFNVDTNLTNSDLGNMGLQIKMETDVDTSLTDGSDNTLEGFRAIRNGEKVVYELLD